jgi:NLI interacting factor-like phosphatase
VQPRPGKKLLVLDLDHTLLDFSGRANGSLPSDLAALKRPHMDAFLTLVYREYDIAVWSQTSWRWLELKLTGTYARQSSACVHVMCYVYTHTMYSVKCVYKVQHMHANCALMTCVACHKPKCVVRGVATLHCYKRCCVWSTAGYIRHLSALY